MLNPYYKHDYLHIWLQRHAAFIEHLMGKKTFIDSENTIERSDSVVTCLQIAQLDIIVIITVCHSVLLRAAIVAAINH